jgi:hypothetical protein
MYPSPNIVRAIKTKRIRLAGDIECMSDMRNAYKVLHGKTKDGGIILKSIFKEIGPYGVVWI